MFRLSSAAEVLRSEVGGISSVFVCCSFVVALSVVVRSLFVRCLFVVVVVIIVVAQKECGEGDEDRRAVATETTAT